MLGGRNLGTAAAELQLAIQRHTGRFAAAAARILRATDSAGAAGTSTAGSATCPLEVSTRSASHVPVSLEQFDAQGPGVPMVAYEDGWHEPEYNRDIGRAWRWTSERSRLWVRPIGRAVTLRLAGESPRRYFDAAPNVRVTVADARS